MIVRYVISILLVSVILASCQKNEVSKIPQIGLTYFGPERIRINQDTGFMQLSLTDGDADLGNIDPGYYYDIYIKDFRYDTGYAGYYFPTIDPAIKDPTKGLTGSCLFMFTPPVLSPRPDSIHTVNGDTTHFEVYIKDKAGHESNHIITPYIILY
jgi:hypothetical protein